MKKQIKYLLLLSSVTLLGCFEGRMNTKQLCDKYPDLRCEYLNMEDGQCRVFRTDLVWHRKIVMDDPSDINLIKEFNLVTEYHKCLELAAQIEPSKAGNKKEERFKALMHTIDEEKRILDELDNHNSPEALYFLWTQGKNSAVKKFLALEKSGALNTAELQYALATYYITRDKVKTDKLLNNALKLSGKKDIDINIFESLASVNHSLKRRERAYVWVLVGREFGVPVASDRDLMVLYQFTDEQKEQLEVTAENIIDSIKDGNYQSSLLPRIN